MQPISAESGGDAPIREEKAALRRIAYAARNAQPDKERISRLICTRFQQLPACSRAVTVLWYVHCRSEVRTRQALHDALAVRDKNIVVPYCTEDAQGRRQLGLWRLEQLSELTAGTWGILEPPPERWQEAGRVVEPRQLDLIMVPGVAFDRRGGRLGNGAGYYDRLLQEVRADTVLAGICYDAQLFPGIPMQAHDIAMDFVVTELDVYPGIGRL